MLTKGGDFSTWTQNCMQQPQTVLQKLGLLELNTMKYPK